MIATSRRRRMGGSKGLVPRAALARNCGLAPEAPGGVHAGSHCSLFVRTSLGAAELKSIPTNQTRLASKMDPARRRSASAGGRRKSGGVRRRVNLYRSLNFTSDKSSLFHLIVVQRANTPPVAAQISKYDFGAIGSFSECRHSLTSEAPSCADDR